ncbi:MAG TPA: CoA transferase, partial [Bacteroidota bacterium]
IGGQQPVLMGNDNFTAAPSGTFATKDGYINIAANKQEQWEAVAEVLGVPELKSDPRFQERDNRKKNRKLLTPLLEAKLKNRETAYWVEVMNEHDVPSGAILSLGDALEQEQIVHRNTLKSVHAEGIGEMKLFNLTAKFEKTPGCVESAPPKLSEHTCDVLKGLGYSEKEIAGLRERKII